MTPRPRGGRERPPRATPSLPADWDTAELEVETHGLTFELHTQVGVFSWERLDTGARILLDVMEIHPGERVLDLGCGYGVLGLVAARLTGPEGHVDLVDCNVVATRLAEANLALNGVTNARVLVSDCAQAVADQRYDVVLSNLPVNAGKRVVMQFLVDAHRLLRPGGRFYFAGPKAGGIRTWIKRAAALFGRAETLEIEKGYRAALAVRGEGPPAEPDEDYFRYRPIVVEFGDQQLEMISKPGIFSWDRLDAATRLLLENFKVGPEDVVLDVGCGYGVIGVVAALRAPRGHVYLVDSNIIAVEAARRSVAHNRLSNAEVILGDGPAAIGDVQCDVIATNPPFHAGREIDYSVAHRFIQQARPRLKRGGRFYLVCNQFIPYERIMEREFGRCEVVARTRGFKLLLSRRLGKARTGAEMHETPEDTP
ncbi:MAG: class I SAM-dependent methyltransferase [Chloroflexi bacterium]|nr:class I SAM-dependent methyltransferase [Chloroflexota bacterium]